MRSLLSVVRLVFVVHVLQAVVTVSSPAQPENIEVRLFRAPGYGPFQPAMHMSMPEESGGPWQRAAAEVRGIPVDLHRFTLRYLNMQMGQYVYQSLKAGLIEPAFAASVIAAGPYDTSKCITKHVDQDIPIVAGIDGEGNTVYVVDTKPDHSFWGKDRIVIPPYDPDAISAAQMDSLNSLVERPVATFEFFDGKKVRELEVILRLWPYVKLPAASAQELRGRIVFGVGVCEHRRGVFTVDGRKYMVAVANGFLSGVYGGRDDEFAVFPAEDSSVVTPLTTLRFRANDRAEIAGAVVRFGEISADGLQLMLYCENRKPAGGKNSR